MEYRPLGKTGLQVSTLGFGCGDVGGLIVRGTPADRERAVARALELGINYFDTASAYGKGQSEIHLGQVFNALKIDNAYVGTKVRLTAENLGNIRAGIANSLEASLKRLNRERVDLFQLHNRITSQRREDGSALSVQDVLGDVVPAMQRLQQQGKTRFFGITGLGETASLHEVIDSGAFNTSQVCYNLLNPSAGGRLPAGFPAQDFEGLLDHTRQQQMGVIAIRVLAAGALSGSEARHPVAVPQVAPIASGPDYATDVQRARAFNTLVENGHVDSLVEAALRFTLSHTAISTVLLGYSSLEHLELAATYVSRGPLPTDVLDRLPTVWEQLAGTP